MKTCMHLTIVLVLSAGTILAGTNHEIDLGYGFFINASIGKKNDNFVLTRFGPTFDAATATGAYGTINLNSKPIAEYMIFKNVDGIFTDFEPCNHALINFFMLTLSANDRKSIEIERLVEPLNNFSNIIRAVHNKQLLSDDYVFAAYAIKHDELVLLLHFNGVDLATHTRESYLANNMRIIQQITFDDMH